MFLYKKKVHSYRTGFGHQHGRHFTVWDTNMADLTSRKNALKSQLVTYPGPGPPSPRLKTCLGLSKYWNLCSNLEMEK